MATSYINSRKAVDVAGTKGWAIPNLNIIFTLTDLGHIQQVRATGDKALLDIKVEVHNLLAVA